MLAETGRELVRTDRAKAISAVYNLIGERRGRVGTAHVVNPIEAFAGNPSAQGREDGREREARSETLEPEEVRVDERKSIGAGASLGGSAERLLFTGLPHRVKWCPMCRGERGAERKGAKGARHDERRAQILATTRGTWSYGNFGTRPSAAQSAPPNRSRWTAGRRR